MHGATFARAAAKAAVCCSALCALAHSWLAHAQTIARRDGHRLVRRRAAGRHRRSRQSGADRESPHGDDRQQRPVPHRRPAPGPLSASTFTLPGFTTVDPRGRRRSAAPDDHIGAEMRVGGVQETITVTGETPVVDVQSTRRVATIDNETVATIPVARGYGNLLATVPGIQLSTGDHVADRHRVQLLHLERRQQQRGPHPDRRHERRLGVQRRRRGGVLVSRRRESRRSR